MVALSTFNPSCYLPTALSSRLPTAIACPPPPSYFSYAYNAATSPFTSTYSTVRGLLSTVVGLPFLSILLIPTTGSYSTTINFFFFYITWSTLILSHPPLRVEFVGTLVIRLVFYVFPSLFFFACDAFFPSAARGFKSKELGSDALPLLNASQSRTLKFMRILGFSILNVLVATTLQILIEILFTRILGMRSALRVVTRPPSPFSIAKHIAFGYVLRDVFTYTIHRYALHESNSRIAKLHNKWYHSLPATFPLSASYDHPLPYLLHKSLPAYLPAMLFRFHLLTYLIYLTLISIEETWTYSGYSGAPMNFLIGGMARRTDAHLLSDGEGNFGTLGIVDWVMGTSLGGSIMEDAEDEVKSKDVQEKYGKRAKKSVDGAKKGFKEIREKRKGRPRSGS